VKKIPFILGCLSACFFNCSQDKPANSLYNRIIFLKYVETNDTAYIGSGFFILKDTTYYLVTAAHNLTNIVYPSLSLNFRYEGGNKGFPIFQVSPDSSASTRISNYYDLAIIKLCNLLAQNKVVLNQIVFPYSQITSDTSLIKKGSNVIGYGYYDFKGSSLLDLVIMEKIDSTTINHGIMEFPRWDIYAKSKFFFLNDSASKGMSGGPIFIANKNRLVNENSKIIGIFHGCFLNKDDNKYYTQGTPLTELDSLINSFYDKK
jgi:hypothetical protein